MGGQGESEFSPELSPPTGSVHFARRREIHAGRLKKLTPCVDGQSVAPMNWGQDMSKFDEWATMVRDMLVEDLPRIDNKSERYSKAINSWKDGSKRSANKQGHDGTFEELEALAKRNKYLRDLLKEPEKVQVSQTLRQRCIRLAYSNKQLQGDLDLALRLDSRVRPDMGKLEAALIAYNEEFFKLDIHHGR